MKAIPTTTKRRRRRRKPVLGKPAKLRIQRNYDPKLMELGKALDQMSDYEAQDLRKDFEFVFARLAVFSTVSPTRAAAIFEEVGKTILNWAEHAEIFPKELENAVREVVAKTHLFQRKWEATPNRKEARARAKFRQTAFAAFWEVAVLHDAGWHRHWSVAGAFPKCPLGSPDPKDTNVWRLWFTVFFTAQAKSGGLLGRKGTQVAAGGARGRNMVLNKVFDELYALAPVEGLIPLMRALFDLECRKHGMAGGTTFLECMAHAHPECVNIS